MINIVLNCWNKKSLSEEDPVNNTVELPKGQSNNLPEVKGNYEALKDFFFNIKKSNRPWPKCECGKDITKDAGFHSDFCPRFNYKE